MTRFVLCALLLAACGDDPCEKAMKKLCSEACDCPSADGKCRIGEGGFTISVDNEADCKTLFATFGCMNDESTIDFDDCADALETAMCIDVGEGNQALEMPAACQEQVEPPDGGPPDDASMVDGS